MTYAPPNAFHGDFTQAASALLEEASGWTHQEAHMSREFPLRSKVSAELIHLVLHLSAPEAWANRERAEERIDAQMAAIQRLNMPRFPLFSALADLAHGVQLFGALSVSWLRNRRSGQSFAAFHAAVWNAFRNAMDSGRELALTG